MLEERRSVPKLTPHGSRCDSLLLAVGIAIALLFPVSASAQRLPAQQPAPAPLPGTTDHLHGVVLNSLTGKPVGRVLVTSFDTRFAVLTDSEARFVFDLRRPLQPASGAPQPQVFVNAGFTQGIAGFAPGMAGLQSLGVNLRKPGFLSRTAAFNLPLYTPSEPEAEIVLKIVPAAVIAGHIDAQGDALPTPRAVQLLGRQVINGRVSWLPRQFTETTRTGDFRFPDLPAGDYKLLVPAHYSFPGGGESPLPDAATGYAPVYYGGGSSLADATPISVHAGETLALALSVPATTFYSVEVPIAPEASGPVENAALDLGSQEGLNLSFYSKAHAARGFLPPGSYNLRVMGADAGAGPVRVGLVHLEITAGPVRTAPVVLHRGTALPVFLRRDFTEPSAPVPPGPIANAMAQMPWAQVMLQPISGGWASSASPLTPGGSPDAITLPDVVEGTYEVTVNPAFQGYVASITSGGTDLLREPLIVPAGGATQPIEVTLRNDSATVRVNVTLPGAVGGASGSQPSGPIGAGVVAISLDEPYRPPLFGFFNVLSRQPATIANVPPGRYLILAGATVNPNTIEYRNPKALEQLLSRGTTVTLGPNQKADVDVALDASAALDGSQELN